MNVKSITIKDRCIYWDTGVRLEVAGVTTSKAQVLVAPNSGTTIIGRD